MLNPEMIREAEGHLPFHIHDPTARWEWMANYLNESLAEPNKICLCCNVTRSGEIMDHLPLPPAPEKVVSSQLTHEEIL